MAQRRMFSKRIVESARFLKMIPDVKIQQAKAFLDNWRTKSKGNEAAYNFIKDQGLQKESA